MTPAVTERACAHCGLPARGDFCCLGCRLAFAASGGGGAGGLLEARLVAAAFFTMGVMTFSLVSYGQDLLSAGDEPGLAAVGNLVRLVLAALAFPVLALLAPPIAAGAWADLRTGRVRMDGLILLAVVAAYGLSLQHALTGGGPVYFETAAMVLLGVTLGRRLEAHARARGKDAAAALAELLPQVAHSLRGEVDPSTLEAGETCEIRPGEAVPADVRVVSGRSEVVAAIVTGEQAPRAVGPDDLLPAGALNGNGRLTAIVLRPAAQGTLGAIAALLEQPLLFTPRLRLADRVAAWLVALAVALAAVGGAAAYARGGAGEALETALAVLLVACPCGLGLAMPLAYRAMRAALARRGVLVRDAAALERAAQVDVVLLDKTGTLTELEGALAIVAEARPGAGERLLATVARSGHRLAAGVASAGRPTPESLRTIPGCGVEGELQGRAVRAGSPAWLADLRWDERVAAEAGRQGAASGAAGSLVAFAEDGQVVALAVARQRLRPGSRAAIAELTRAGLRVEIVSGDRRDAVESIATELALPSCAEARPETKLARVEQLQRQGRVVLVAGDGVNDAPALRAADVGVALGSGTALARGCSPVELAGDDLRALAVLVAGSRRLASVARGSVAWTLAYNGVALVAAACGLLHPLVAVAAMIASSLAVAVRSWRLLEWRPASETTPSIAASGAPALTRPSPSVSGAPA